MGRMPEGFDARAFQRDLKGLSKDLRRAAPGALDRALHVLADEIRRRAPVETGTLKASVRVEPAKLADGVISQEVIVEGGYPDGRWYVGFVEFGTSRMAARPFIRPAIRACRDRMTRIILSAIRK